LAVTELYIGGRKRREHKVITAAEAAHFLKKREKRANFYLKRKKSTNAWCPFDTTAKPYRPAKAVSCVCELCLSSKAEEDEVHVVIEDVIIDEGNAMSNKLYKM